jgi:hypothetical protein
MIDNLCMTITKADCQTPNRALGTIVGEGNTRWRCLWPPSVLAFPTETTEAVSLELLLQNGILHDKSVRLKLGAQLASAMLQLHETPWLGESWGMRDVFVLQKSVNRQQVSGGRISVWEPLLDRPFVRRTFGPMGVQKFGPPILASDKSPVTEYDKSLFSLGIVLIELSLEQRIQDLHGSPVTFSAVGQQPHDNLDYIAAGQRLGEVFKTEEEDYALAVACCIHGLNLPKTIPKSLEIPQYKNEVYTHVVSRLERNLKVWLLSNLVKTLECRVIDVIADISRRISVISWNLGRVKLKYIVYRLSQHLLSIGFGEPGSEILTLKFELKAQSHVSLFQVGTAPCILAPSQEPTCPC